VHDIIWTDEQKINFFQIHLAAHPIEREPVNTGLTTLVALRSNVGQNDIALNALCLNYFCNEKCIINSLLKKQFTLLTVMKSLIV